MSLTKVTYSMIENAPVNIVDYGAVGNGTTDDSTAFQTAINALSAAGGGTIDLGNRTYVIQEVVCKSNVNFVGQNATILRPVNTPNFTRLMYIGSDKAGGTSVTTLIENVSFTGITFNGNIANQLNSAADYDPVTKTIAFNSAYQQNHSVYVGAESTGSVGCKNVRFVNCTFNGSQGDGMAINTYAQNVYVTNMYGRACARGCFDLFGGSSTVFVDGLKADDYVHVEVDITTGGKSTCTMVNCVMSDLSVNGIYEANSLRVYFTNCVVNGGPTFLQAGGYVTNCTFNIGTAGGTTSHRIIRSENLVFQSCNFFGTATLLSGPLVSLEPSSGETRSQLLTFDDCNFEAGWGSQSVTGIQETVTWHGAAGGQYFVRNCRFRNLFAAIDVKKNGYWYVDNNLYFLCNAAYAWRQYSSATVERFVSRNNTWQECNYYGYFDENSNTVGSTSYLYDTDWIHSSIVFPQFDAPNSYTSVQSVKDRRQFYSLASEFSTSTATGTPFAWNGCRVWITDSDATTEPVLYYKTTNYPSPADPSGRSWAKLVSIP